MLFNFFFNFYRSSMPDIIMRCKAFMSEVISTIFFGQHYNRPDPDLISELISMAFQEQKEQIEVMKSAVYEDSGTVAPPPTRSFLLQLLLDYKLVIYVHAHTFH